MSRGRSATTISVGGGKGGVGKSVVASNLSIAIARLGFRVVLVDADLGSANQHTLFGVERTGRTIQTFIERKIDSLEEALVPTRTSRLFLLPGTTGVIDAANIGHARKLKLIRHIRAIDADVVVIDCGAGSSFNVLDLYDLADLRIVVTTPQLTALQNAYGFLKVAVYRSLRQSARTKEEQGIFDRATTRGETERIRQVLEKVQQESPAFAFALRSYLASFGAYVVGNQLEHDGQRRTFSAFSRLASDFLSLQVPFLGAIIASSKVHASVTRRRPLLMDEMSSVFARTFSTIAEHLLSVDVHQLREGRKPLREEEEHLFSDVGIMSDALKR